MFDLERFRSPAFSAWLAARLGDGRELQVIDARHADGGSSSTTILLDLQLGGVAARMVARVDPGEQSFFLDGGLDVQWQVIETIAHRSSLPVPRPRWYLDDASLVGQPFFLTDYARGIAPHGYASPLYDELDPGAIRAIYAAALRAVAGLHALERAPYDFLAERRGITPDLAGYLRFVGAWYRTSAAGERVEQIEQALRLLEERQPAHARIGLLWGDCRIGNMLIDPAPARITAILDWEAAALGPPEADVAWWLMFDDALSRGHRPAGFPDGDEVCALYESHAGLPLERMEYYLALAWCRWAIVFIRQFARARGTPAEAGMRAARTMVHERLAACLAKRF